MQSSGFFTELMSDFKALLCSTIYNLEPFSDPLLFDVFGSFWFYVWCSTAASAASNLQHGSEPLKNLPWSSEKFSPKTGSLPVSEPFRNVCKYVELLIQTE